MNKAEKYTGLAAQRPPVRKVDRHFQELMDKLSAEGNDAVRDFLGYDIYDEYGSWEDDHSIDPQTIRMPWQMSMNRCRRKI